MLKIAAIVGLAFLLIGGAVLAWVVSDGRSERDRVASCKVKYGSEADEYLKQYSEWLKLSPEQRAGMPLAVNGYGQAKTKEEIRVEQRERLNADLDRLATGELDAHPYADILYGKGWQEAVRRYSQRKERNEFVLTGSVVCTSIGGATVGMCFVYWLVQVVIGGFRRLNGADTEEAPVEVEEETDNDTPESDSNVDSKVSFVDSARATAGERRIDSDSTEESDEKEEAKKPDNGRKKVAMLFSEKNPDEEEKAPMKPTGGFGDMVRKSGIGNAGQTMVAQQHRDASTLEQSLKAHTLKLEKQMDEFRRMYNTKQNAAEQSQPLNGTLEQLTQQVSAIRDYAANQQQRVEKLQDGYDWNIIRTFCLRVIRCIDNLEGRIERLSKEGVDTTHLEEVRDELIFALESSGVEQFKPEENSAYRGQEKSTEAVKEREHCEDSKKVGTIAKVVRPGYQYIIDEGNLKVVRSAQVKLFG